MVLQNTCLLLVVLSTCTISLCTLSEGAGAPIPLSLKGLQRVEECVSDRYPPNESKEVKWYNVNLDLPPGERWNEIAKDYAQQIKALIDSVKEFADWFSPSFEKTFFQILNGGADIFVDVLPQRYAEELRGIAREANAELGEVVLYNLFYEFSTMLLCTSVVAQDTNGNLYHGRNLDFGTFMGWNSTSHTWTLTEALKQTLININWQKNGATVFKSINFAGYIGILTAVKPGAFAFSLNTRFKPGSGLKGMFDLLFADDTPQWLSFLSRDVLENAGSYDEAKDTLSKAKLISPIYFILSGTQRNQGCLITRDRNPPVRDIWTIEDSQYDWFIIETNHDHWKKTPFYDNRRDPGIRCLETISQENIGVEALFNMMSSRPVLNKSTVYTVIMQASSGTFVSYVQDCPDPCWLI